MSHSRRALVVAFVLAAACGAALADDAWIHVRVESDDLDRETVRVNIPLAFAEAVLPMIDVDRLVDGQLHVEGLDIGDIDVARILDELARTDDGEFVRVRDGGDSVTVAKQGDLLLVHVEERDGEGARVRVRVPLRVVRALIGEDGDPATLDLAAAVAELGRFEGDLVHVEDGGESVRVWIDRSSTMAEAGGAR